MFRNLLIRIKYDGSEFCGWQRQPKVCTVQGEIERALKVLCAQDIKINGTSRTDAGVHALEQCATFEGDFAIPTENIKRAANNMMNNAVQITEIQEVPKSFHARFSCDSKTYMYKIQNRVDKNPFGRHYYYFVDKNLNIEEMNIAARYIEGTHDFKSFQASGGEIRESTIRTIRQIRIVSTQLEEKQAFVSKGWGPKEIQVQVTGDGFLYNMVRIIVGTLVEVGMGKIKASDVKKIIESGERKNAGHTAPPQGLYLKKIYFK